MSLVSLPYSKCLGKMFSPALQHSNAFNVFVSLLRAMNVSDVLSFEFCSVSAQDKSNNIYHIQLINSLCAHDILVCWLVVYYRTQLSLLLLILSVILRLYLLLVLCIRGFPLLPCGECCSLWNILQRLQREGSLEDYAYKMEALMLLLLRHFYYSILNV